MKKFQYGFVIALLLALTLACSAWAVDTDTEKLFVEGEKFYNAQKYGQARESFTKASDQGHARAQTYLGFIYANGLGVSKDETKAIEYWQMAAQQGDEVALNNLTNRDIAVDTTPPVQAAPPPAPSSPTSSEPSPTYKFYQTENIHNKLRLNIKTGEVYQIQDDGQIYLIHAATTPDNEKTDRYALYKTQNMWTFILLDKWTGKLWQCQYSVEGIDYMGSWVINPYVFSYSESSKFTIEPLVSMYQYYLINEETGEMWKFQWTTEGEEYRWIEEFP